MIRSLAPIVLSMIVSGCFFEIKPEPEPIAAGEVVSFGSTWRYLPGVMEQGWQGVGHDDSGWASGAAPLGFGECDLATEIANNCDGDKVCSDGESFRCDEQFITYYFRHTFDVTGDRAGALAFDALIDDGAVFYLNGTEVQRLRLPSGPIAVGTEATEQVSGNDEDTAESFSADGALLSAGKNVVAVEVHNEGVGTDVIFELALSVR